MVQISKATKYNWNKLKSNTAGKLKARANKTLSTKRVIATSFLDFEPANLLLENLIGLDVSLGDIMYSLCVSLLKYYGIYSKKNVAEFISQYQYHVLVDIDLPDGIWVGNNDVLGFVYQSLMTEGERNLIGQYYTSKNIAEYMLCHKCLMPGETFLDPCCGSGTFLLSVNTNTPESLYGFDIDSVAVMMAGTNLLVKYRYHEFVPHVYCLDFLQKDLYASNDALIPTKFDNIYTNPPWGTDKKGLYINNYPEIKSKERSSMFIIEAVKRLKTEGNFYFLLPMSLLKTNIHRDVRKYILSNTSVQKIDLYTGKFDGVFTDYFSIKLFRRQLADQTYVVTNDNETKQIKLSKTEIREGAIVTEILTATDKAIMEKLELRRHDDLTHSEWALGIVTGDNKEKVKKTASRGLERVYTGKQVAPFNLKDTSCYISFTPKMFQQCAKEKYYRAPEKLIYKFIAKYPVVAYDDKQSLCLNSANILIPKLDSISIKSVAALLNSILYRYYYTVKFKDIKVLKGNLQSLPFPKLSQSEDENLSKVVTSIQALGYGDQCQQKLDAVVFSLFKITPKEQAYIKSKLFP